MGPTRPGRGEQSLQTDQKFKLLVFEYLRSELKGFLESSNGSTRTSVAGSRCQMVPSVGVGPPIYFSMERATKTLIFCTGTVLLNNTKEHFVRCKFTQLINEL
jgi:hypothetical protein